MIGQEGPQNKAAKTVAIIGIMILVIVVVGFVFVRYLPSRQQAATVSTPVLD